MQFTYYSISIVFNIFFAPGYDDMLLKCSAASTDKNAHKIELQLLEIICSTFDSAHQNVWGYSPGCIVVTVDSLSNLLFNYLLH
jgi:hypothetical protein